MVAGAAGGTMVIVIALCLLVVCLWRRARVEDARADDVFLRAS